MESGKWVKVRGSAVRISVDPNGNAWVANNKDVIYRHDGKRWVKSTGAAKDIGVGADGSVWAIGTNKEGGGFDIYARLSTINANWERINGAATDIDVDGSGNAWTVNAANLIFEFNGKIWKRYPGKARDIGVAPDGQVWVVGTNKEGGGYGTYQW